LKRNLKFCKGGHGGGKGKSWLIARVQANGTDKEKGGGADPEGEQKIMAASRIIKKREKKKGEKEAWGG